ncbi:hypothetical protein AB0N62_39135 [Streptomyces sp. NPDC093982]|uniref:hypothetical protein n=1 Tax=Streptomyces sp. NPDC093982 TaxID=3155077 RepID=UPI00343BCDCC
MKKSETAHAGRVVYFGMPAVHTSGESRSYVHARWIVQAFANWDMQVSVATYEDSKKGWRLVLTLNDGSTVHVEVNSSGPRTRATLAVNNAIARPVDLPPSDGWETQAARIARAAWRTHR